MSSGNLPLGTYHRASSLGEGTYGSVVTVYDDGGAEFALKLFIDDEDSDSDSEEEDPDGALDLGTLREISILRALRCENSHPNVVEIHDVKTLESGEEGEELGAGTGGCIGIAMPLFRDGTLGAAIDSGSLSGSDRRADRVGISHGLMSALAFLHGNGIMHRDVKADNVMIVRDPSGPPRPVLIDFSLAKIVDSSVCGGGQNPTEFGLDEGTTHTSSCGTPTYRSPEVIASLPYGIASDVWSAGVVLLEMIRGRTLEVDNDRGAMRVIGEERETLPDQPLPNLVKGALREDPRDRTTAAEALDCPLFAKFGLSVDSRTFGKVVMAKALPLDGDEGEDRAQAQCNDPRQGVGKTPRKGGRGGRSKIDPTLARRMRTVQRICNRLGCAHPLSRQAAMCYAGQMEQLEEGLDDVRGCQALLDCAVLAARFFERDMPHLPDLDECESGDFADWSLEGYRDNETTLWMMMDFCLYPRNLLEWES